MNNVVQVKLENLRNIIDVILVSDEKDYLKWTSKLSYIYQNVFDNDLVTIGKHKTTFTLNKPAYAGMCMLDLIKVVTYELHYEYIKNKFGNNARLLLINTDSLMYEIKTEDFYDDFSKDREIFDFSNYSAKSNYYDDSNKLFVRKKRDKTEGVVINQFVGLNSKMFPFLIDDSSNP